MAFQGKLDCVPLDLIVFFRGRLNILWEEDPFLILLCFAISIVSLDHSHPTCLNEFFNVSCDIDVAHLEIFIVWDPISTVLEQVVLELKDIIDRVRFLESEQTFFEFNFWVARRLEKLIDKLIHRHLLEDKSARLSIID